jgi:uncharacterized protein
LKKNRVSISESVIPSRIVVCDSFKKVPLDSCCAIETGMVKSSGMNNAVSDFRTSLVDYIRANARPWDKFSHQARLYRLAVALAADAKFDDDVLFGAAWLHDLGVFLGHRPEESPALAKWDHLAYVIQKAPGILREIGFPTEKIPAVIDAISTHMPYSSPESFEGTLVRDADILEQLGAVGILRTVSKVGRDTRFNNFSDALRVLGSNAAELPGKLQLGTSKREAESRIKILQSFLAAAKKESAGVEW